MSHAVRPLQPEDYRSLVGIVNAIESPWQTNEAEAREEDFDVTSLGGTVRHFVAVDSATDAILGHAVLRERRGENLPGDYQLELRVDPACQRLGIGTRLWDRVSAELDVLKPVSVQVSIRDCFPGAHTFASRRGFRELSRSGPWRLNVRDFSLPGRENVLPGGCLAGVIFTSLAEERDRGPGCLRKLHALRGAVDADIPAVVPHRATRFEDFLAEIAGPRVIPEALFIAKHRDDYIGLSWLNRHAVDAAALNQSITGVVSSWRRKGVATALKLLGIEYARRQGYATVATYVDSMNEPMAALNRKLGFRPGIEVTLMERR